MKRAFKYDGHHRRLALVAWLAMPAPLVAACGGGDAEDSRPTSTRGRFIT